MYLQAVLQDKKTIHLRIATLIRTRLKTFIMVYRLYRTDPYKKDSVYLCMYPMRAKCTSHNHIIINLYSFHSPLHITM
jgi:hypothetical protein